MARSATTPRGHGPVLLLWALIVGTPAVPAWAAPPAHCFEPLEQAAKQARPQRVSSVLLTTPTRLAEGCELALSADGPWSSLAVAEPQRFAELALALTRHQGVTLSELPARLYARRAADPGKPAAKALETLELAACSPHLLEPGQGFEVRIPFGSRRILVRRSANAGSCGAAALELAAVAVPPQGPEPALLAEGPWPVRLPRGEPELSLDPGAWALYALGAEGSVGVRLGRVDSHSSGTPLQSFLAAQRAGAAAAMAEPWLRASWAIGRLRLEPMSEAQQESEAWTELRAAAAAGQLWVGRVPADASSPGELISPLLVDRGGRALALPSSEIEARMRARYGEAAASMVPSLDDWTGALEGLSLCLAATYDGSALARVGGPLPADAHCATLAGLVAPLARRGGPALPSGRVCLRRKLSVMTASGVETEGTGEETCQRLPTGAPGETREPPLLAALGDELLHSGTGSANLFLCTQNACRPLPATEQWIALEDAGLIELRHAPSLAEASNPDGLTLLRLGVIDPGTEWHPVGLLRAREALPDNRWMALDHDEDAVFTYVRGRQQLDFRLSTAPELAAVWNADPTARTQLAATLPRLERVRGALPGPRPSALVTLVTTDPACPGATAQELWSATDRVEPDALPVGRRFHVLLAEYQSPEAPLRCVARASFVVMEHLQLRAADRLRVGLLGDARAVVFLTAPAALGVMLPAVYLRWAWVAGLGLDVSGSLTAAVSFDQGALSRAGLGLSTAVFWGPEAFAPRLLEVGAMLHAATGTHPDAPIGSVYVGLNLSTLVDLAGGR
jgi:hypothetical protein